MRIADVFYGLMFGLAALTMLSIVAGFVVCIISSGSGFPLIIGLALIGGPFAIIFLILLIAFVLAIIF